MNMNETKRRILIIDDNRQIHKDYRKILEGQESPEESNEDFLKFFEDELEDSSAEVGSLPSEPLKGLISIDSAMQGEEGLQLVTQSRQENRPYHLAFVDLRMPPGWDGLTTVEAIWKVDPELQIVICSAYSDNSYADICKRLGRSDSLLILKKPFDAIEVYQLAVALTEKWILGHQARLKQEDLEELVRQRTEELRLASLQDPLTKLINRAGFNSQLEQALSRVYRHGKMAAVFLIDVDYFKQINDGYGHPAGDQLLIEIGHRLKQCTRDSDTVARLGGDEFAIIQSDVQSDGQFRGLLRRIEELQKLPFVCEERKIDFSFSIGVSTCPPDSSVASDLLKKADQALYRSKRDGRSTSRFYSPDMDSELVRTQRIYQGLKIALEEDQFLLHYQPIVNAHSGKINSFEALIRWNHDQQGMVSPNEFIPIAEETGIIVAMGEWILQTACAQATAWPEEIAVSVNMSPVQFREHHDVVSCIANILETTGLAPERLAIEITENAMMSQPEYTIECLHRLREMGVSVVLDDFGVGYSSLSYVQGFPFDRLKLDKSFVSLESSSHKTKAIMKLVGSLGINLNIVTTAEGVETLEELKLVQEEGFRQVQGYLIGRPEPFEKLKKYFETNHVDFESLSDGEKVATFPVVNIPDFSCPEPKLE